MRPYVIRQGDHLMKLGSDLGFDPDAVWSHPKNADLRAVRANPHVLSPGDVIFVPEEPPPRLPFKHRSDNGFKAKMPRVKVKVTLDEEGTPLAEERYRLEGLGDPIEGRLGPLGQLEVDAPVHVRELMVTLLDRDTTVRVLVGELDPVELPSGARMRLTHLGYYGETVAGSDGYPSTENDALAASLRAFQVAQGLEATGELDAATRGRLREVHGS